MKRLLRYVRNLVRFMKSGGVVYATVGQIDYGRLLKGKCAVVTGGTSGIGFAIAQKFLALGATVCIVGRNEAKLEKAVLELSADKKAIVSYCWDLQDISDARHHVAAIGEMLGSIDIWVNNAGIYVAKDADFTESEWDAVMDTDCRSLYFIMETITKKMQGKRGAAKKIINITSNRGVFADRGPYGAAKIAAISLTQGFAKKFAPKGIIINSIAPGITASNINHMDTKGNLYVEEDPNYRVALPQELAELAAFLASDAANHIVGQNIVCDGGQSLLSV